MSSPSFEELNPAVRRQVQAALSAQGLQEADVQIESPTRAVIAADRRVTASDLEAHPGPGGLVDGFTAAKLLGCSNRTLRKLVADGKLSSQVGPRNRRFYTRSGIEAYLALQHSAQ